MKLNVQKENGQRGITLIALVITIIVLLILAGVAINMAIDSNGLFGKANDATEAWNIAVENERSEIQGLLDKIGIDPPGVVSVQGVSFDKTSITIGIGKKEQLIPIIEPNEATNKNVTWISSDETKVTVDENGIVTGISEGTATITVTTENKDKTATCTVTVINPVATYIEETSTIAGVNKKRKAPIPVGFTASQIGGTTPENTIAGGLVIYEGTDPVTGEANSTEHTTAMTTRNQFVWIPVDDVNQIVMCKNNASGSVCNLELQKNTKGDYALRCKKHNATGENTTELCGRLYAKHISTTKDTASPYAYTTRIDFTDRTQKWDESYHHEPGLLSSSYDNDQNTGGLTVFSNQMNIDFENMAVSIAKYGGFYISRYEIGENGASLKDQKVLTGGGTYSSSVCKGVKGWYGLYNTVKSSTAVYKTGLSTHMIFGSQYDQIINFIGSEAQSGHPGGVVTRQSKSGTMDTDKLKNIYDLEGNNFEWTAQAASSGSRVNRGGDYYTASTGKFRPSSEWSNSFGCPTNNNSYHATRSSLCL